MSIGKHGARMFYRGNPLDLDPTCNDTHGRPLMRIALNLQDNNPYMKLKADDIAATKGADLMQSVLTDQGAIHDVSPCQTRHNIGGHIMAAHRDQGVLNRFRQAWDMHDVFALGAGSSSRSRTLTRPGWWAL